MKRKYNKCLIIFSAPILLPGLSAGASEIIENSGNNYKKYTNQSGTEEYKYENNVGKKINNNEIENKRTNSASDDTIVVTGSHIRGVQTSVGSQIISVDREEINRSGYSSVRDIFENLPQNFGGGATGERQINSESLSNSGHGTTVNLRGIGSNATLVLLNGRRLPASGFEGSLVDTGLIPIAAIERVEILPDGASAVYGSDAIAGVVNFILKKDYEGFETRGRVGSLTNWNWQEYQVSQTAAYNWDTGNIFVVYEYTHRDRLGQDDIKFTRSADFRKFGGQDRRRPVGDPGVIIDPMTLQAVYSIKTGELSYPLTVSQLVAPDPARYREVSADTDLFARQDRHSVFLSINQDITKDISAFFELRYGHRKFSLNNGDNSTIVTLGSENPFYVDAYGTGEPISVWYSFYKTAPLKSEGNEENIGLVAGLNFYLPLDWNAETFISHSNDQIYNHSFNSIQRDILAEALSSDDPSLAFNPFGENNPELLRRLFTDNTELDLKSKITQAQVILNGNIISLNESDVKAAIGSDYREERFTRSYRQDRDLSPANLKRKVYAFFGEIYLPIFTGEDGYWYNKLEVSSSIRYESYKDRSFRPTKIERERQSSTDPRIGLNWSPTRELTLRASYGTSFRAPSLYTLASPIVAATSQLLDRLSQSGTTNALTVFGSRELNNETAKTWTLGAEFAPLDEKGVQLSVNYFRIRFKNQVVTPIASNALTDPSLEPLVNRNPTIEEVIRACELAPLNYRFGCDSPELVRAIIDGRATNFAKTMVDGIDIQVTVPADLKDYGLLTSGVNVTHLMKYKYSYAPSATPVNWLDRPGYPLDFRARGSLSWLLNNWSASIFVNYSDSYWDHNASRPIKSHTTFDLTLSYGTPDSKNENSILNGLTIQLIVNNIFNNDPPFYEFVGPNLPYDPANAEVFSRSIAISVAKKW